MIEADHIIDPVAVFNGIRNPVIWIDYLPHPDDLKEMFNEYPGLEKAYENFKTVYDLVEPDWKEKSRKRRLLQRSF